MKPARRIQEGLGPWTGPTAARPPGCGPILNEGVDLTGRQDPVDEPRLQWPRAGPHAAEEGDLLGLARPTRRGRSQEAPLSREDHGGEDHGQLRRLRADDEVAPEGEGEPRPDGEPVDLGDGRLRNAVQRQRDVAQPPHAHQPVHRIPARRPVQVAQVGPSRRPRGTGQHHHLVVGLGARPLRRSSAALRASLRWPRLALGAVHVTGDHATLRSTIRVVHGRP